MLVIPVEFNPHANDDFSGFARYDADDPSGCVTEPAGTGLQRADAQPDPEPRADQARQQHAVGAGLQPGLLQQAHLLHPGHHQEGAPGPQRRREHQGPDRSQLLPGDLQGPVRPVRRRDELAQLQRVRQRAPLRVRHALGRRRRSADGGLHAVQRSRHAPVVPGLDLLEQRRGRPPVRAAEHRVEGHRPARRRAPGPGSLLRAAAAANPSRIDALPGRQQAADVAFGPVGRYPFQACFGTNPDPTKYYEVACNRFGRRGAVRRFTDAIGWYPGFEYRPDLDPGRSVVLPRRRRASVVVPSNGNQIYSTRVTDKNGRLVRSQFGTALGDGHVAGTGNPRDLVRQASPARCPWRSLATPRR
jgi:hypothetical protein